MDRDGALPRPAVKPGPGLFVAAVVGIVAASAGCSTRTNTPSPASTPTVHETTSAQSTVVDPSAKPPTATADPTFVGHWHVHGATMDISPATATIIASNGPCGPGVQGMCHDRIADHPTRPDRQQQAASTVEGHPQKGGPDRERRE